MGAMPAMNANIGTAETKAALKQVGLTRKCPHCKVQLQRIDGKYALVGAEKSANGNADIKMEKVVPVVVYVCVKCGNLELASAIAVGEF
jgi:hypothetical protein